MNTKPTNRPCDILVIEDSPSQRMQIVEGIQRAFASDNVIGVESWIAAGEFLRETRLVVLDWHIGALTPDEIGALDTLRRIRVPYVIYTGDTKIENVGPVVYKSDGLDGLVEAIHHEKKANAK